MIKSLLPDILFSGINLKKTKDEKNLIFVDLLGNHGIYFCPGYVKDDY
jgi:hypothetical protein